MSPSRHVAWDRVAVTGGCLLVPLGLAVVVDTWVALWGLLVGIDLAIAVGVGRPAVEVFDGPTARVAPGGGDPGDAGDPDGDGAATPTAGRNRGAVGTGDGPSDGSDG